MSYNASQDTWYQYFKNDSTQSSILLGFYGIRALWATVGIVSNMSIVYITFICKSLHGVCNILIAMESFFAIFQDVSFYISFFVYLSGVKFITYQTCFPILIPLAIFGDLAQMTMVFTGVDRLLSVLFPIWYKKRNKKNYLQLVVICLAAYGIYDFIVNHIDFTQSDAVLMSCSTEQLGQGGLGTLFYMQGVTLSAMLMGLYVLIWILVFVLRPIAKTVNEQNRKLAKSLIFIIGLNLTGVFIKCGMSVVFTNFWHITAFDKTIYFITMSFMTITVYSANAPVLYVMSKEYRSKFNARFKWLSKMFEKSQTAVQPHPATTNALFTNTVNNYTGTVRASQLFIRRANCAC